MLHTKEKGKLSIRFRNINIILFLSAFCVMAAVMLVTLDNVIGKISSDYARRYGVSSAEVFSARIVKEIGLVAKAAHSEAVTQWLSGEQSDDKKLRAYEELSGIIGELYSNNLYVGVEKSLNEYQIEEDYTVSSILPFDTFDAGNPEDEWYFDCIASNHDYELNVGIDHVLQRKRVWLNYKVEADGAPLGVICTGLEFSHIVGELFSQYNNNTMRGLIIDENGIIYIDSYLWGNEDFLHHAFETRIEDEFPDPAFLDAIKTHLDGIDGFFETISEPQVYKLTSGPYRYATIAPIRATNWSAVIIYDSSSSLGMLLFVPVAAFALILLIAFALATNAVSYRLIFLPLGKLRQSLARLKENNEENIYGTERDDELGGLSNAIKDWFTKANYDVLTGIYNRRFMENNFEHIMESLSRSGSTLSVFMIDVDYFKKYNDTYGHDQGDICLKSVAGAVAGSVTRLTDFAARYGGEEFAIVLPNTDQVGASLIAEKLLENVRGLEIPHAASDAAPFVTVSVGITTGTVGYGQTWEEYLKRADDALYMSKQNGRNQYTFLEFTREAI